MKITTNNVPRPLLDSSELSASERKQFDFLDWPALDNGTDSASFFRYRGDLHYLGNVERVDPAGDLASAGWHGAEPHSAWTATVVRLSDDGDSLVVGFLVS